ncbi:Glycosyl transferase, family 2 [hydrothermal vent metagenome]|uniref:Glycosyl transferase, family 2 n=1 Tax=hydrothermal vent metagenome TaxID=652676 RepID=A0A3B0TH63_9ZZZZ
MLVPKITIVTPSYNQAKYLEDTICSVLNQNYPNLEYIIIDGGSSDNSVDIIKKYEDQITYWVSEKDNGQAHAVNKGFKKVSGDIVGWLNSDDIYLPGTLDRVAYYFSKHPDVEVVYGNHVVTDQNNNHLWVKKELPFSIRRLEHHSYMSQPATFLRRSVINKVGYLDEKLYYLLDWEYFIRVGNVCKFKHVPDVFATYRLHKIAKTAVAQSGQPEFLVEKMKVIERHRYNPTGNKILDKGYCVLVEMLSYLARFFVVMRSNPINYLRYVNYKRAGYR